MPDANTAERIFGEIADLYDEVRPEYPRQMAADVLEWSELPEDARLLEIGCGTGKATRLFAPYGHSMTCIDPAGGMLDVARRTCAEFPKVEFAEAKFEEWTLPGTPFDLVYSAQAFHWIEPVSGLRQVADALRSGGAFSLFWHVSSRPDTPLRRALDDVYAKFRSKLKSPARGEKNTKLWPEVVRDSGHFTDIETGKYEWVAEYDADTWVRLLQTHSNHRSLAPSDLGQLLSGVRAAIKAHGDVHRVDMTTELVLARKP